MRSARYTRRLDELSGAGVGTVGGKAASLGALAAAGLPVPEGFVLTVAAFADATASASAGTAAATPSVTPDVRRELAEGYRGLGPGDPSVAVRSSAVDEDGVRASFAGQHETLLGVRGEDAVVAAVERVWASLRSERADAYRRWHGREAPPGIAVVVQRLVEAEAAGVMFSADPRSGDPGRVLIEAAWGLGQAVVDGLVTPDRFLLEKASGRRVEVQVAEKDRMTVSGDARTEVVEVPAARRRLPCLSAVDLEQLVALARRIEEVLGRPADVEWAIDRSRRVHVLQARPITTIPAGSAERQQALAGSA